jgi:hypothetical protein
VLAHQVVLALPGLELHDRDAVPCRERLDIAVEGLRSVPEHRGRGHRHPQVLPDEPDHAQVALQPRHVHVAVDPVDALQLEGHMAGQDISGRTR